ncbi:nuclear transport factor 2 family protein [Subtercola lobariae]|uniref:SnoaL-like domain-containing protein n=1 Tax=Subtercola lobariae TaxID=1588641 RepID=A0A917B9R6_9MICO|nr:nuclear transport factor 2 family protein [Subtercola lobariae]GGF31771.1 hypothetical protein GCM10011399_26190 [Subtercola lobariae]
MSTSITDSDLASNEALAQREALDASAVIQVVLAERQARDRGWWDRMADSFWPDSTVRLSWHKGSGAGFVAGTQAIAERGQEIALHQLSAPVAHVRGDRAFVESTATMRMAVNIDGVAGNLTTTVRLNYRLERRDGRWRIFSLDAIYENTTLFPAVPGQVITVDPDELTGYRSSYALLAWNIARRGITPSTEDLGDDRPDDVKAFYDGVWSWLEQQ